MLNSIPLVSESFSRLCGIGLCCKGYLLEPRKRKDKLVNLWKILSGEAKVVDVELIEELEPL